MTFITACGLVRGVHISWPIRCPCRFSLPRNCGVKFLRHVCDDMKTLSMQMVPKKSLAGTLLCSTLTVKCYSTKAKLTAKKKTEERPKLLGRPGNNLKVSVKSLQIGC
jgi:hypothetical protein